MNAEKVKDALRRLGFYYVESVAENGHMVFYAGHVGSMRAPVVVMSNDELELAGPYAELIKRLLSAFDRYQSESQDIIIMRPEDRANWIRELAEQAGVTSIQFADFVRTRS